MITEYQNQLNENQVNKQCLLYLSCGAVCPLCMGVQGCGKIGRLGEREAEREAERDVM